MGDTPILLLVVGPPAVGKMTVGEAVAARTGMPVFHNHLTIEPVLRFFPFGTPAFLRLVDEFRTRLIAEVAESDLPGLVFTFVRAFELEADGQTIETYAEPFRRRGGRVLTVELSATQDERLRRNVGASRLAEKPSKRNLEHSRRILLELDEHHRLNSDGEFDGPDYLRVDNTDLTPDQVATLVIERFGIPVS
jgi:hypothetical protein